jgi:hypothetical protein
MNKKEFNIFLMARYRIAEMAEDDALRMLINSETKKAKTEAMIYAGKAQARQIELMYIYAEFNDCTETEAVEELKKQKVYS